jgi:hypothetical protein
MTRSLCLILLAAVLGGCARGPKQPWGWLRVPVNKTAPPDAVILPKAVVSAKTEEGSP